ncbi:MAG: oligosaccharide repeat unit polymerase [Flavobacteriales bacterium]|nr:oligosaccharide repeat unit polymerase [Flavobacteriales bacterium]
MKYPSDIFITLYLFIVFLSHTIFNSMFDTLLFNSIESLQLSFILILPILSIKSIKHFPLRIFNKTYFKLSQTYKYLILFSLFTLTIGTLLSASFGSFSFTDIYARRLEARSVFTAGSLVSYFTNIMINGIMPLLIFVGYVRKQKYLLLLGFIIVVFSYWVFGYKHTFFQMIFFYLLAFWVVNKKIIKMPFYFSILILGIFVFSFLEYLIFDNHFINQLIIRRLFAGGSQLQMFYYDTFTSSDYLELLFGVDIKDSRDIAFYIGEKYFPDSKMNANSNTFIYALLKNGIVGYIISIFLISLYFFYIDKLYIRFKTPELIFLSTIFGVLLLEQFYTTVLLSSGIGFIFALTIFTNFKKAKPI